MLHNKQDYIQPQR